MDTDDEVHKHSVILLKHKEAGNNAKSNHWKECRDDHSRKSKADREINSIPTKNNREIRGEKKEQ